MISKPPQSTCIACFEWFHKPLYSVIVGHIVELLKYHVGHFVELLFYSLIAHSDVFSAYIELALIHIPDVLDAYLELDLMHIY